MRLEDEIKQKQFQSEHSKGLVNLTYTASWLEAKSKLFFEKFDLTPPQYNVLRILRGQHPKGATVNLIRERMLDKMSDASRIVERLRIKNLLERTTASYDRRAVDIVINEKGLELLQIIDSKLSDFEKIFKSLSTDEVKTLNILLDKLRD